MVDEEMVLAMAEGLRSRGLHCQIDAPGSVGQRLIRGGTKLEHAFGCQFFTGVTFGVSHDEGGWGVDFFAGKVTRFTGTVDEVIDGIYATIRAKCAECDEGGPTPPGGHSHE